jgi:sigma-B regulation protein RsbU (phosphoserine phosphatase)
MHVIPPAAPLEPSGVDEAGFEWPLSFMRRKSFRRGEFLFRVGERAEELFYVVKGTIRLPELNRSLHPGQVVGEMGIFSPAKERTASAVAEEDLEVYAMDGQDVRGLMSRDPGLATKLIEVIIKRMMEHLKAEAEARARINAELRIAREIQLSMLPRTFPPFPGRNEFEIHAMMEPANEVGGDFYDFFFVDETRLCVLVGDVSEKGIHAALLMALSKALLRSEAMRGHMVSDVIARVNKLLCPDNPECMFVTVFCLVLDTRTGEVEYCSAGHNPPVHCTAEGVAQFVRCEQASVIGFDPDISYQSRILQLRPGELLLLYTDGVTEAENSRREQFSEERLRSCLCSLRNGDTRHIIEGIRLDIASHAQGQPQSDDITLLALKYSGARRFAGSIAKEVGSVPRAI